MRGIVRANEEIRAGRRELLHVPPKEGAEGGEIAEFPVVQRARHCDPGQRDFGMLVRPQPPHAFHPHRPIAKRRPLRAVGENADMLHSTVTLFARLRGWSTSVPLSTAV